MGPTGCGNTLGTTSFFIELLKTGGLFEPCVEDCPLHTTSNNASTKRDLLGTLMLSMLSGHRHYADITSIRHDQVNPPLLGMSKVCSEDAVRRAFYDRDQPDFTDWLQKHLKRCYEPLLSIPWILDVDTTIKTIDGHQEGAVVGYNPHKPGSLGALVGKRMYQYTNAADSTPNDPALDYTYTYDALGNVQAVFRASGNIGEIAHFFTQDAFGNEHSNDTNLPNANYDLPTGETETLADRQSRMELSAKQRILTETPEVEIPIQEAWENGEIQEPVEVTRSITRYRYDLTREQVIPYQVEEKVTELAGTGRFERQQKEGVRFDETTGKFYRQRTLEEVTLPVDAIPPLPEWILSRIKK